MGVSIVCGVCVCLINLICLKVGRKRIETEAGRFYGFPGKELVGGYHTLPFHKQLHSTVNCGDGSNHRFSRFSWHDKISN